ncbi:MAG: FAD:protein FMN transferase [Clostridia bacterium]|nr:FAD:protein FMN transferase [Clostridia bacterium]
MKKTALLLTFCLLLGLFSGCAVKKEHAETFFFMDTVIGVTLYTKESKLAEEAFSKCSTILSELDALWARQQAESDVARWNAATDATALNSRTAELIHTALEVSRATNGAFDITVAPLVELWQSSGERNQLPSETALSAALAQVGYEKLSFVDSTTLTKADPHVAMDLGGIGKGAAIDALLAYLTSLRLDGGLITFGSNVAVFGEKPNGQPFRIGLRDPQNALASVGIFQLREKEILSVSGDYERYVTIGGKQYHHILDCKTGYPADQGLASVAVIASDGVLADALSTALFVMGYDAAIKFYKSALYDFEAVFISGDGGLTWTDGLSDRFTATEK